MEWLKQWLIGVTAAAMLNAVAESLMPRGMVRQIGKLTGGLVLLFAILRPICRAEEWTIAEAFAPYISDVSAYGAVPEVDDDMLIKSVIEEECGAYIQNKALEAGIECRADVRCGTQTNGYPYPTEATVKGVLTADQIEWLTELIERELDIPKEAQRYETESGETT